jgi:hypothetical protein
VGLRLRTINYAHAVVACAYFVGSQTVMVKVSVAGLLLALLVPRLLRVFAQVDICYVDDTKPCSCDLQDWDMTLDIDYYRGKQLNATSGDLYFTFAPCNSFQCANTTQTVQICMYNRSSRVYQGLGRLSGGTTWRINSLYPLNFTIEYEDGDPTPDTLVYSLVNVVYSESESSFTFLGSHYDAPSNKEVFVFQLLTSHAMFHNNTAGSDNSQRTWLPGTVVGSWAFLVLVLTVIVTAISCSAVKYDRWKRKKDTQYRPILEPNNTDHPS